MLGEDLSLLKVPDLLQLEQQLDLGVSRVKARKASIQVPSEEDTGNFSEFNSLNQVSETNCMKLLLPVFNDYMKHAMAKFQLRGYRVKFTLQCRYAWKNSRCSAAYSVLCGGSSSILQGSPRS